MQSIRNATVRALFTAPLLLLSGCGKVLDIPDDPKLAQGPWSCLDNPRQASAPAGETAIVRIQACNFVSTNCAEPATGITAKLCDKKDVTCANPIEPKISDTDGALVFEVQTGGVLGVGFDGYLQIVPPLEKCTNRDVFGAAGPVLCGFAPGCDQAAPDERCNVPLYAPTFFFFNPAIKADVTKPMPLPLVPTSAVLSLIEASGVNFDPTTGMVFVTALDCNGNPASGVSFNVDKYQDRVTPLYVDSGVVSSTVTQTDVSGVGGFVGVPSGFIGVEGSLIDNEGNARRLGDVGLQVTSFNVTYSTVVPSL